MNKVVRDYELNKMMQGNQNIPSNSFATLKNTFLTNKKSCLYNFPIFQGKKVCQIKLREIFHRV